MPSRSMVLKAVTGKILKTWKLFCCRAACGSVLEPRVKLDQGSKVLAFTVIGLTRPWERPRGCAYGRLSRITIIFQITYMCLYYRTWKNEIKKKVDGLRTGSKLGILRSAFSQGARKRMRRPCWAVTSGECRRSPLARRRRC